MLLRSFFALSAACLLATHVQAGTVCSPAIVSATATNLRVARTALIAVPVGEMDTDVPPAAGRAIERFKDRLQARAN